MQIATGRMAQPEELAELVRFLVRRRGSPTATATSSTASGGYR